MKASHSQSINNLTNDCNVELIRDRKERNGARSPEALRPDWQEGLRSV